MGRESWVNNFVWFLLYTAAVVAVVIDANMSIKFLNAHVANNPEGTSFIAVALAYIIAIVTCSVGGLVYTPWGWSFLFEIPQGIAIEENSARRNALIFGYVLAAFFVITAVLSAYGLNIVSTMFSLKVVEGSTVPRAAIATMIVVISDLCLFMAHVTKRQAKGAKKAEREFDDRMNGFTTVDAQYVDEQYAEYTERR